MRIVAALLAASLLFGGPAAAAPAADAVLLDARRLAERGDRPAALDLLENRLAQPGIAVPDAAALHLEAAGQAVAARDRARARQHLSRLDALLPELARTPGQLPYVKLRMGLLHQALGDLRQAEPLLAAAVPALAAADAATRAQAGNALGMVRLELQRPDDAVLVFRRALELPGLRREVRVQLLVNLADAQLQAGQRAEAAATLARAEAQADGNAAARAAAQLVQAQLLLNQARLREAEALLEQAGARDAPVPDLRGHALMLLARARFDRGQMPEAARTALAAVAAYQESLGDWHPALARTYHLLGNAYGELRDRETAKGFFARAVDIEAAAFGPDSPQAQATQLEWAWIELQEGKREAAERRAAVAAPVLDALEGTNPRLTGLSRVMAGLVAEESGRAALAVQRYREAQALIGRAGEAGKADRGFSLVRLGRLLTRMGQLGDAAAPLDEAIDLYPGLGSAERRRGWRMRWRRGRSCGCARATAGVRWIPAAAPMPCCASGWAPASAARTAPSAAAHARCSRTMRGCWSR
ncbi:tetratricopeptide repeat protein [Dankookia sp. P2]|uniref:tetratricopeptide repeat protein n=1 Tax=Dankookia sp. P2 TaxID=3423955 RepID=UPI003D668523